MEVSTLPRVTQPASGDLLHGSGSSDLGLRDSLEGWDGMGGEREVQEGRDMCMSYDSAHG